MGQIKNIKLHIVTDIKSTTTPSHHTQILVVIKIMVAFGDLSTPSGLKALNEHLASRSYIEGYVPSQADTSIFSLLSCEPGKEFAHSARWFRHIKSYSAEEQKKFPGVSVTNEAPVKDEAPKEEAESDSDDDMFGSDSEEETEEEKAKKAELLKAYHEKKSKKPTLIAKSNIILEVKPWADDTDLVEMERLVRSIELDGLVWGQGKLVPLAYGVKKLSISCVVEDLKVGSDILQEMIEDFKDHVQSVDVAAFNKI